MGKLRRGISLGLGVGCPTRNNATLGRLRKSLDMLARTVAMWNSFSERSEF